MDWVRAVDECLSVNARLFGQSEQRFVRSMAHGELALTEYLRNKGCATPGELCRVTRASTARMAKLLGSMERNGQILRRRDAQDGRRTIVSLTKAGKEQAEEIRKSVHTDLVGLFQRLGQADTEEYLRILGRIVQIGEERKAAGEHALSPGNVTDAKTV